MTIEEFVNKYNMHDSLIDSVSINKSDQTIEMIIDFAYWMQNGYKEGMPDTGPLALRFVGVKNYNCPEDLPLDEISIIKTSSDNGNLLFSILNDMTDDYLEIAIEADAVEVTEQE